MVEFIQGVLTDLLERGQVVSVEVEDASYLVTLVHADRTHSVHHLSAWDVSRSMRGDTTALAALRAGLRGQADGAP
jgi:hypothetical protein